MAEEERTIENTPSWALASICTIFVVAGVLISLAINQIEKWLSRAGRKSLVHTVSKMKEELMQVGFISILLIVFQSNVEHICIKESVMNGWNPCPPRHDLGRRTNATEGEGEEHGRRLMGMPSTRMNEGRVPLFHGRALAEGGEICKEGYTSIMSVETLHQLHLYLFLLAMVHVIYTLVAMLVSTLKMRRMRSWEDEAQQSNPRELNEATKLTVVQRNRSFVEHHLANPLSRNAYSVWIVCLYRQFTRGVTKSDYLSLRHGFISTHNLGHSFDFHGYLLRSLELEYPNVVGITPFLWAVCLISMLFNTHSTHLYFWISLVPAILLVIVGAKLQHVIATLALECADISRHGQFTKSPLAPRDDLFWFNKPEIILFVIHYIIFQDAFETTTFISYVWAFGLNGCIIAKKEFVYTRLGLSIITQFLCCYQILPAYAVVIQMGSHLSPAIFRPNVRERIATWRKEAKRRVRMRPIYEDDASIHVESVLEADKETATQNGVELYSRTGSKKSTHDADRPSHNPNWSEDIEGPRVHHHRSASEPVIDAEPLLHGSAPPEDLADPRFGKKATKSYTAVFARSLSHQHAT